MRCWEGSIHVCPVPAINKSAFATCLTPRVCSLTLCLLTPAPKGLGWGCKQHSQKKFQTQKGRERCISTPEKPQLPTQASIPCKIIFAIDVEISALMFLKSMIKFMSAKPALQKILGRIFQAEENNKHTQGQWRQNPRGYDCS